MASNPMQRKVRNAFLGGFLISLVIAVVAVGFLYTKLRKVEKEAEEEKEILTANVYVVDKTITSGGVLKGNISYKTITAEAVPTNAVKPEDLSEYVVGDEATNITIGDYLSDETISKIKLEPGTILTTDMIGYKDGAFIYEEGGEIKVNSGVRMEEYNMIALPSKLAEGDYIDIRLQLPTGETFIVASKKYVEDTDATTVWIKVSEEEILAINNAIVEAYSMKGSKLYANVYVEGGYQGKADVTYVPSEAVLQLIDGDGNIINTAREYLKNKYTDSMRAQRNQVINYNLKLYEDDRLKNTEEGITKEIEDLRDSRQQYLDALNAY